MARLIILFRYVLLTGPLCPSRNTRQDSEDAGKMFSPSSWLKIKSTIPECACAIG